MSSPRLLASSLGAEGTYRKSSLVIQGSSDISFDQGSSRGADEKWLGVRVYVHFEGRAKKISWFP